MPADAGFFIERPTMARTPNGTITSVATVLAAAKTISAITNAAEAVCSTNADTVVRRRAKTGAVSLIPVKVSFNEEETLTEGQAVTVKGTFNAQNISTRYAA